MENRANKLLALLCVLTLLLGLCVTGSAAEINPVNGLYGPVWSPQWTSEYPDGLWQGFYILNPSKNPDTFVAFLVAIHVWKSLGWGSIIYLAALSGIDQEMLEAASIDGAGRWKRLIHITLPSIAPMIAIQLILTMGSILGSDFEQIYLYTGGQRYNPQLTAVAETFDTWIYRNGIASGAFSGPAAMGLFQSLFGAGLVLLTNKISKRLGYEGIW